MTALTKYTCDWCGISTNDPHSELYKLYELKSGFFEHMCRKCWAKVEALRTPPAADDSEGKGRGFWQSLRVKSGDTDTASSHCGGCAERSKKRGSTVILYNDLDGSFSTKPVCHDCLADIRRICEGVN